MESIFQRTIRKDGRDYRVDFSFDDEAIMDEAAGFEITAGVKAATSDHWTEVTLRVEVRLASEIIVLSHNDRELARLRLRLPLDEGADFSGEDVDIDRDAGAIEQEIGTHVLEEIIHLIPADPFLGCLIKGAVSTAVGQIIRCWNRVSDTRPYRELAHRIVSCLRDFRSRMLFTFMWRAGRCAALGGFN
jgi:hypothetical protein